MRGRKGCTRPSEEIGLVSVPLCCNLEFECCRRTKTYPPQKAKLFFLNTLPPYLPHMIIRGVIVHFIYGSCHRALGWPSNSASQIPTVYNILYLLPLFDSINYILMSVLAFRKHCWNCSNIIINFWWLLTLKHVGSGRLENFGANKISML